MNPQVIRESHFFGNNILRFEKYSQDGWTFGTKLSVSEAAWGLLDYACFNRSKKHDLKMRHVDFTGLLRWPKVWQIYLPIDWRLDVEKIWRIIHLFSHTGDSFAGSIYSLDADSCLNTIKRFVARRGQVRSIRSDNGANLIGSETIFRKEI